MSTTDRSEHWAAVLAAYQASRRLPTLIAGVAGADLPVWIGVAGERVAADTQFRIGSITKTMTGVLVLQCRDDGLLDLDDPLGRFVPETGYRDRTLRMLLSHTSGMQSEPVGDWWERSPGVSFDVLNASNDGSGSVFDPGTTYHYSNLGFALLGEVVTRVRGAAWADVLRERVLEPLGMGRTSLLPEAPAAPGWSVHHLRGTLTPEPAWDSGAMAPAGQLWSTITDLLRFAAFLAHGEERVLATASLEEMRRPVRGEYGLAMLTVPRASGRLVGHPGSMPGFQACVLADPDSGEAIAALTNATTGFSGPELARRLLEGPTPGPVEPWRPTERVPDRAEELLGWWFWGNSAFECRWSNDRLELHDLARQRLAERFELRPDRAGAARIVGVAGYHAGETLHVVRGPGETVHHLVCATFVYTRTPYDPTAPIPGSTFPDITPRAPGRPSSC